jgi:hypothetical protein
MSARRHGAAQGEEGQTARLPSPYGYPFWDWVAKEDLPST